jgi:hypothetical protein
MKLYKCRSCESKNLSTVFSLGYQKLTGFFLKKKTSKISGGSLSLVLCDNCTLLQLGNSFNHNELYGKHYGYRSSLNRSMVDHLKKKAFKLSKIIRIKKNDIILDIGSNDGTFLSFFKKSNKLIGVDPTIKKFKNYYRKDIIKITDFFSYNTIKPFVSHKKVKLVTSISMFYDLENPIKFAKDVERILDINGIWHLEQSYLPSMLKNNSYDTICHEHLEYYSLNSIEYILNQANLKIIDLEFNPTNGGSFALNVAKKSSKLKTNKSIIRQIKKKEIGLKLNKTETYKKFFLRVKKSKASLLNLLNSIKKNNKTVIGYGASTKGNVILQFNKINSKIISRIAEVNKFKFNKYTPGSKIKIISQDEIKKLNPDYLLVLPWHFKKFILKKEKKLLKIGKKFIFPLPKLEIV